MMLTVAFRNFGKSSKTQVTVHVVNGKNPLFILQIYRVHKMHFVITT
jgi:hypothetical protein